MQSLKLVIEYDGTNFHGWQRQPHHSSIQQTLEEALKKITGQKIHVIGSGRTDSGVHAFGQIAHCRLSTHLSNEKLLLGLNSILPKDIAIKKIEIAALNFHAQKDVCSKVYIYNILNTPFPSPLLRRHSWRVSKPLNISKMKEAAKLILGEHDFKAFQNQGTQLLSTVRTIYKSSFKKISPYIVYEIEGSGFLKQMVRNVVGALGEVGKETLTVADFKTILESKNRKHCPRPAPPQGLFLKKVFYNNH